MPRSSGRAKRYSAVKASAKKQKLLPKQKSDEMRCILDTNAHMIYAVGSSCEGVAQPS